MHAFRFHPPPLELSPELRWVLERAFAQGPPSVSETKKAPLGAVRLALALGLGQRIQSRCGAALLREELGRESAAGLAAGAAPGRATAERLLAFVPELAHLAAGAGVSLVLLKGAALDASGVVPRGSRPASDIDVLPPAHARRALDSALRRAGFEVGPAGILGDEHQLPPLDHPARGLRVEIQRYLRGVSLPGTRRSATADALTSAGLLEPVPALGGTCFVPRREVLVGHALAHGLGHHGFAPATYPLGRMVADLLDLGLGGPDGPLLAERAAALTSRSVPAAEVQGAHRLCAALASGDPALFAVDSLDRPETLLLRHIVAGATSDAYRRSMALDAIFRTSSELPRPLFQARTLFTALMLTRSQIDVLYGVPASPLQRALRRLARPFELLVRFGRMLVAARSGNRPAGGA